MNKICNKCGKELPLILFYKDNRGGKYGVRSLCKICFNKNSREYRKSIEGVITQIYHGQKRNSILRGHPAPNYTKEQLIDWLRFNPRFYYLYNMWLASGYKKEFAPSCDRKSSLKPYSFDNLQIGTFAENHKNENIEIKLGIIGSAIPVIGIFKKTGRTVSFISASEAERRIGVHKTHISACCLGKRKSTGGYIWKYAV